MNGKCGERYTLSSPSTATTPKEKTLLAFLIQQNHLLGDLAGVKFFLKKKRMFFLSGFCPPGIRVSAAHSSRTFLHGGFGF